MGLSSSPKEALTTHQVIVDIAQCLKTLTADSKAFDALAKQAYALPAAEQARALEAKENIAKYEKLLAEHAKASKDLDDKAAANTKVINQINAQSEKLAAEKADLKAREKALEDEKKLLADAQKAQAAAEAKLIAKHAELDKRSAALDTREAGVNQFEAELKERAKKFKVLTEGL